MVVVSQFSIENGIVPVSLAVNDKQAVLGGSGGSIHVLNLSTSIITSTPALANNLTAVWTGPAKQRVFWFIAAVAVVFVGSLMQMYSNKQSNGAYWNPPAALPADPKPVPPATPTPPPATRKVRILRIRLSIHGLEYFLTKRAE